MLNLATVVVVAAGAALGGVLRLAFTALVVARAGAAAAPLATLAINVAGSFLIGIVVGAVQTRVELSPLWRAFLATGILGGFTTFSTFALDAVDVGVAAPALAAGYVIASVALAIVAAYVGLAIGRTL
ncbi:MAG: hypothetical protein NVS4B5_10660 [Vulcanimicrobiaceae bacterium]